MDFYYTDRLDTQHKHKNYRIIRVYNSKESSYTTEGCIGSARYSVVLGKVYIDVIQTRKSMRGQGIASHMIDMLDRKYGYSNIVWGMTTESGTKLKEKMDLLYKKELK